MRSTGANRGGKRIIVRRGYRASGLPILVKCLGVNGGTAGI